MPNGAFNSAPIFWGSVGSEQKSTDRGGMSPRNNSEFRRRVWQLRFVRCTIV